MPVQPVGIPRQIQISDVTPGSLQSGDGGGLLTAAGSMSVRIDGDSAGVFSVTGLDLLRLMRDPELPPDAPRVWETVLSVDGPGPVTVGEAEAIDVTVTFACPANQAASEYDASAAIVVDSMPDPVLQIPVSGSVASTLRTNPNTTLPAPVSLPQRSMLARTSCARSGDPS